MNKMLLKLGFLILVLLLLVVLGMNNRQTVQVGLRPLFSKPVKAPAALMYYGFFAVGVASGALLAGGKKGGGAAKSKPSK